MTFDAELKMRKWSEHNTSDIRLWNESIY